MLPAASTTRSQSTGSPMAAPMPAFSAAVPWTKRGAAVVQALVATGARDDASVSGVIGWCWIVLFRQRSSATVLMPSMLAMIGRTW